MNKNLFVITGIANFKSKQEDSEFLVGILKKFSGFNCLLTFKIVQDQSKKLIEEDKYLQNVGNTNPDGIENWHTYIKGIKNTEKGKKIFFDEKIKIGSIFEIEYAITEHSEKTHIVPKGTPKYVGFVKLKKVTKTKHKINKLF